MNTLASWWRQRARTDIERRDAQCLLAGVLGYSKMQFFLAQEQRLALADEQLLDSLWQQRQAGVPVPYLLQKAWFWGMELHVTPEVLIPRPDTETLVSVALQLPLPDLAKAVDLGTGSGAVVLALSQERPHWQLWATDLSLSALEVAKKNALQYQQSVISFRQGRWVEAITDLKVNLVISNPPYIAVEDPHLADLQAEPVLALTAGDRGLAALYELIETVAVVLEPQGWLLLEHGAFQGQEVREHLIQFGWQQVATHRDMAGRERVTQGCRDDRTGR